MPGETRDLGSRRPAGAPEGVRPSGKSYVVTIGIDDYVDSSLRLHNAVNDARLILEELERCGFQEPPGIRSLFDREASMGALTSLVRDDLAEALQPGDSLVLFYAGHGETRQRMVPDPDKPGATEMYPVGYLLPADARPGKTGTWLDLESFLHDVASLPALHILVILDACKSGFALDRFKRRGEDDARNMTLDELARRPSRRVITSALADQSALDVGGSDNSLFTEYLGEGIRELARGNVTGADLFMYVRGRVSEEAWKRSGHKQTPDFGYLPGHGSGDLVLSLRGDILNQGLAQEHLRVADAVYRLGQWTGEKRRFAFAASLYRESGERARAGHAPSQEADLGLGKALFAADETGDAVKVLEALVQSAGAAAPPGSGLWLGVALGKQREYLRAAEALAGWSAANGDHPHSHWAAAYSQWLRRAASGETGRRRALIIGNNKYQVSKASTLGGCRSDAELLMARVLAQHCGFAPEDMTVLLDDEALLAAITSALDRLVSESAAGDVVWVFYSGHAVPASRREVFGQNPEDIYLLCHDTHDRPGHLSNGMSAAELHGWMQRIPAERKVLALDTHADEELMRLAQEEGTYALILASDSAEITYEGMQNLDGKQQRCGILSMALYEGLRQADIEAITFDDLMIKVAGYAEAVTSDRARYPKMQTPFFEGSRQRLIFGPEDVFVQGFEFAEHGERLGLNALQLARQYAIFERQPGAAYPPTHLAFGRALLSEGSPQRAIPALERALEQRSNPCDTALLPLIRAHLLSKRYREAAAALPDLSPECAEGARAIQPLLASLAAKPARALIVDVADPARSLPAQPGTGDPAGLVAVLVERWDLNRSGIMELKPSAATSSGIREHFIRAVEAAGAGAPFLFYYRGQCGWKDGLRLLTSGEPLDLEDLAECATAAGVELIAVLDGGAGRPTWLEVATSNVQRGWSQRFADVAALNSYLDGLRGAGTWITSAFSFEQGMAEDSARDGVSLTAALTKVLRRAGPDHCTLGRVEIMLREHGIAGPAVLVSDEAASLLLLQPSAHMQALGLLDDLERWPVREVAETLEHIIKSREDQDDPWPEGRLNAGIAHALTGDLDAAIVRLEEAVAVLEGRGIGREAAQMAA